MGTTNKADQLGNYASFDPALASLAFKGTIPIGKAESTRFSYLGIGINGDLISNGVAALFNSSKLNTNVGIQLDYNFRLWKATTRMDEGLLREYETKLALLNLSTLRKLNKFPDFTQVQIDYFSDLKDMDRLNADLTFYINEVDKAKQRVDAYNKDRLRNINLIAQLTEENERIKDKLQLPGLSPSLQNSYNDKIKANDKTIADIKKYAAGMQKDYSTADFIYEQQTAKLAAVKKIYDPLKQKTDSVAVLIESSDYQYDVYANRINTDRQKIEDSLFNKLELRGINMHYLTATAATSQKEYYTYDKKLPFGAQLAKQPFTTYKFGLAWNHYIVNIADNRYLFYRLSGAYLRDNNTDALSTMSLAQETVIKSAAGDTTRKVSKTYNVYTDPLTSSRKFNFSGDIYFLFGKRTSGFHLSASYFKPEKLKNYTDLSAGYLVSFQGLKKEDPLINVEVYYKFADVYDNRETGIKFWQRNEIGFKVGLPFALLKK